MNSLHPLAVSSAHKAAAEIRNTLNTVAGDVRELNHSLDELRAEENKSSEPSPGAEVKSAALAPPHQQHGLPAAASEGSAVQRAAPTVASVALPQIPDLRPQLEAFMNTVVRNQQATISLLQGFQRLAYAQTAELEVLRQRLGQQQNIMGNLRRY